MPGRWLSSLDDERPKCCSGAGDVATERHHWDYDEPLNVTLQRIARPTSPDSTPEAINGRRTAQRPVVADRADRPLLLPGEAGFPRLERRRTSSRARGRLRHQFPPAWADGPGRPRCRPRPGLGQLIGRRTDRRGGNPLVADPRPTPSSGQPAVARGGELDQAAAGFAQGASTVRCRRSMEYLAGLQDPPARPGHRRRSGRLGVGVRLEYRDAARTTSSGWQGRGRQPEGRGAHQVACKIRWPAGPG